MKKIIVFFSTVILLSTAVPVKAQLTIEQSGRVVVGNNRNMDDPLRAASLSIYGHAINGNDYEFRPGAKITFGDFGSFPNYGWNAFVGEFGEYDSDILWLHGKNGICITTWNGLFKIAEWGSFIDSIHDGFMTSPNIVPAAAFSVNGNVLYDRTAQVADDRRKSDITTISNPLDRLMQIKCQYFKYNDPLTNIVNREVVFSDEYPDTTFNPKGEEDNRRFYEFIRKIEQGEYRYGLDVTDTKKMFADLVRANADGTEYINYVELIPVIIAAIQDLYNNRSFMMSFGNELNSDTTANTSNSRLANNTNMLEPPNSKLYQNTPNPFSSSTEIKYYIPNTVSSAEIYIFNLTGELMLTVPVSTTGYGSVTIDGSTLKAGMYIYSLVADNEIIDSKRMILTR